MPMQDKFDNRYGSGAANKAFFISDALIFMKSYTETQIEAAAERLTDNEVAAFHRVIAFLNLARAGVE